VLQPNRFSPGLVRYGSLLWTVFSTGQLPHKYCRPVASTSKLRYRHRRFSDYLCLNADILIVSMHNVEALSPATFYSRSSFGRLCTSKVDTVVTWNWNLLTTEFHPCTMQEFPPQIVVMSHQFIVQVPSFSVLQPSVHSDYTSHRTV
jgi:hypothetical protein